MTTTEDVKRLIFRGDGSFSLDPKGDWISARDYDAALAEIDRLRKILADWGIKVGSPAVDVSAPHE